MAPLNHHKQASKSHIGEGAVGQMRLETIALLQLIILGRKEIAEGKFALASTVLDELED